MEVLSKILILAWHVYADLPCADFGCPEGRQRRTVHLKPYLNPFLDSVLLLGNDIETNPGPGSSPRYVLYLRSSSWHRQVETCGVFYSKSPVKGKTRKRSKTRQPNAGYSEDESDNSGLDNKGRGRRRGRNGSQQRGDPNSLRNLDSKTEFLQEAVSTVEEQVVF